MLDEGDDDVQSGLLSVGNDVDTAAGLLQYRCAPRSDCLQPTSRLSVFHGDCTVLAIRAHHDLLQVEASFGTIKLDLWFRPIIHLEKNFIDAHLTLLFAATANGRHMQEMTRLLLRSSIKHLEALWASRVTINEEWVTIDAHVPTDSESVEKSLLDAY